MKNILKSLKIARLKLMARIAQRSPCLAQRWGLVGIFAATIVDGPDKGMPLGVAWAIDAVRRS